MMTPVRALFIENCGHGPESFRSVSIWAQYLVQAICSSCVAIYDRADFPAALDCVAVRMG